MGYALLRRSSHQHGLPYHHVPIKHPRARTETICRTHRSPFIDPKRGQFYWDSPPQATSLLILIKTEKAETIEQNHIHRMYSDYMPLLQSVRATLSIIHPFYSLPTEIGNVPYSLHSLSIEMPSASPPSLPSLPRQQLVQRAD